VAATKVEASFAAMVGEARQEAVVSLSPSRRMSCKSSSATLRQTCVRGVEGWAAGGRVQH
jgi:hypothetical protein